MKGRLKEKWRKEGRKRRREGRRKDEKAREWEEGREGVYLPWSSNKNKFRSKNFHFVLPDLCFYLMLKLLP
jgi:hypothetical protein